MRSLLSGSACPTKENREGQIRNAARRKASGRRTLGSEGNVEHASLHVRFTNRSKPMKWETPQASDMRFGFEITMYIATR
jgi:pyrroloquinoline quinone biosynthesis protein A